MKQHRRQKRGLTLIELLVVLGLIGILIALVLPAIQQARESARRMQCKNNLKQIGAALHNYHDAHNLFPPGWIAPGGWAWSTYLLPFLEQQPLYNSLYVGDNYPPDPGTRNDVSLKIYICPSDRAGSRNRYYAPNSSKGYMKSNYPGIHAFNDRISNDIYNADRGIFGMASSVSMKGIIDGSSNTFLVGERQMSSRGFTGAIWMRAVHTTEDVLFGAAVVGTCGKKVRINDYRSRVIGFSSMHPGGAQFLMADGAVRFISEELENTTYQNLADKDDGNVTPNF
jgi:prepilin-type N-terminal cleavage/methylation domain-containing protein/prepilin-type processing-associated H-X9-DG protein